MTRIIDSGRIRWISMVLLGWTLAGHCTDAMGQEGSPPVAPDDPIPPTAVSTSEPQQELLDRLRKMEQRLDQVTKQNEELSREVQELRSMNRDQGQQFPPRTRRVAVRAWARPAAPLAGADRRTR